ncbi:MAG TPA: integrin alpha, partial [Planctomycetota bacterium]|nr:integrin alpha [Planctomycetota bacterium]
MKPIRTLPPLLAVILAAPLRTVPAQTLPTFSAEPAMQIGWVLAGIGDADADGFPDVALGDTPYLGFSPLGRVVLQSGATGGALWAADGENLGDRFGAALARAGDLDGDGRSDLVVGAPGGDWGGFDSGRVYVVSGASGVAIRTWAGDTPGGELGDSVAGGRDVDGDGAPDVVAGAPETDLGGLEDVGFVRVFSGATGATIHSLPGTVADDEFGTYVALVGDVDGDARSEFAATRYVPGTYAGEVRLFSGATGAPIFTWTGAPGDGLGIPMAAAGDLNADGTPDLIAVARFANTHAGIVRVFSGANGAQLYAWPGPGPYAYWGSSADGAGDVDGDGFDDVIVGSPTLNGYTGMARVFSGATGGILFTWPSAVAGGVSAVASAGDLDQDGRDDVVVGHAAAGLGYPQPGQAVARSGLTGGVMFTWAGTPSSLRFGHAVAGIGDLDSDGVGDIVVGGHGPEINGGGGGTGTARAYSGATGDLLLSWSGIPDSQFGWAVAGCGDLDMDGVPDIVVGAPAYGFPAPPEVTVFSGSDGSVLRNWIDLPWTRFGSAVAGAGDVDGDGTPDVAVGAPMGGLPWNGEVRIYSGSTGTLLRGIPGTAGSFGTAVARAGDVNGDGIPDLLVGDPQNMAGGPVAGQARVYSGANGAILYSWNGPGLQAAFGTSVAGGGDVDGDGWPDLAVGAPGSASNSSGGQAFVFSGATGTSLFIRAGITVGEGFGTSLAIDGDANGDGWADLAVGVPGA